VPDQLPGPGLQLRSLVTAAQTVELSLAEVDTPAPEPHQVIVRVEAAPINPSDLGPLLAGADLTQATAAGTADRPVVTAPGSPCRPATRGPAP
jgi:threonine dehydrogenase-like Zn-dependent dehydrogenase